MLNPIFCVVAALLVSECTSKNFVCINASFSDLSGPCVTNFSSFCEFSLRSETTSDFTTILLQGGHTHHLNLTLSISGVHEIEIEGNGAEVKCFGNTSGTIFNETSDITIRGITFVGCGSTQPSTSTDFQNENLTIMLRSALYFVHCTTINISLSTFEENNGIGVVIYNPSGLFCVGLQFQLQ